MTDGLALPATGLARRTPSYAQGLLPAALFHHSVRTYLYGRLPGERRGCGRIATTTTNCSSRAASCTTAGSARRATTTSGSSWTAPTWPPAS
ncbi:hypothetical protein [Kitasatospora sp. NPDC015120]|uniref:hypothetical protein n=1 Tax=Kitasatospora sp. NPDC015120 TaxID=3364023 RepID=UPI0036F465D9